MKAKCEISNIIVFFIQLLVIVKGVPIPKVEPKCGYQTCPAISEEKLNIHIISHTHDDVGWLKTVDQYYYGNKNNIQNAGVQYILDSVVDALLKDSKRKFIYVETAFFWRWWREQSDKTRNTVKKLVNEGRLEFIGGGWSMNDEGASHYNAIIDNMSWGLRVLNETFGQCGRPKVAWQIDPFGHSREQASIFAQMGFDGLFFGRLDYRDMMKRKTTKTMEVVWKGSDNLGKSSNLFTGVLPNLYQPPIGFCFDILCQDAPIMDDIRMADYNLPEKIKLFMRHVKNQESWYKTNNIVMTMGNDFYYQNAAAWYKNLDKLIYHVNKRHPEVNLFYSTPSCYLHSLHKSNLTWTKKEQDFMPYASEPHAYWSGYFTSRPTFKRLIRYSNNFLQICKQLHVLSNTGLMDSIHVTTLRQAVAVVQHHDAVTGTAKQHVTDDYYERLYKGIESCQIVVNNAYKTLLMKSSKMAKIQPLPEGQIFCNLLNISQCQITESSSEFSMTVYNPMGRPVQKYVRLPVTRESYVVADHQGNTLNTQMVPILEVVKAIPGRNSSATFELIFRVDLPALGFTTYQIKETKENGSKVSVPKRIDLGKEDFTISNEILSITFDGNTGYSKTMKNQQDNSVIDFNQQFYWYYGREGNNAWTTSRASGAYIFRPNGTHPYELDEKIQVKILVGPLLQEVHQIFNSWISQVIRLYKGENHAEFEWLVGPIPVEDKIGKEVISRFDTSVKSGNVFYTDSNGREMLKRIRDMRPDYKITDGEPVAMNYFPVNSRIFIKDKDVQLNILTDRSQAASSLYQGSLELMIHRRLLYDDGFGVGEPLNEVAYGQGLAARGTHYVQLSKIESANVLHRELAQNLYMAPWISFATSKMNPSSGRLMQFSGLKTSVPRNVHLLTLEKWTHETILIRLEHYFEKSDDPENLSKPVKISLTNLFTTFHVTDATEMSLDGVHTLAKMKRLEWRIEDQYTGTDGSVAATRLNLNNILLKPMQIRTFTLKISN